MLGILFAIPKTLFNGAFIIPLSDDKNIWKKLSRYSLILVWIVAGRLAVSCNMLCLRFSIIDGRFSILFATNDRKLSILLATEFPIKNRMVEIINYNSRTTNLRKQSKMIFYFIHCILVNVQVFVIMTVWKDAV
jgi:hypothetical protein